jgi:hypothetical protein
MSFYSTARTPTVDELVEASLKESYEEKVKWYNEMKQILKETGLVNDIVGEISPYIGNEPDAQPFTFNKESHLLKTYVKSCYNGEICPEKDEFCDSNFMETCLPGAKVIYSKQFYKAKGGYLYSGLMVTGYKDYIIISLYLSILSFYYPMGIDAWKYIFDKCSKIYTYGDIRYAADVTNATINGVNLETILDRKKLNKIRDTPVGLRITNFLRDWNSFHIDTSTLSKNLDEYHRQKELVSSR